jgi:hypothetical protein
MTCQIVTSWLQISASRSVSESVLYASFWRRSLRQRWCPAERSAAPQSASVRRSSPVTAGSSSRIWVLAH